jgi:hypothetical protein
VSFFADIFESTFVKRMAHALSNGRHQFCDWCENRRFRPGCIAPKITYKKFFPQTAHPTPDKECLIEFGTFKEITGETIDATHSTAAHFINFSAHLPSARPIEAKLTRKSFRVEIV